MSLLPSRSQHRPIIKQSYWSLLASAGAATELVYISTYGGDIAYGILVAISLIVIGFTFSFALQVFKEDTKTTTVEATNQILFAFIALGVFIGAEFFVPQLHFFSQSLFSVQTFYGSFKFDITTQSGFTGAFLFTGLLIPVAEEQFFRGFWGNFFLLSFKKAPGLAVIAGGALFGAFHLAVYGLNLYALSILATDGATMIAIDAFAVQSIDSSILAHISNNVLAFSIGAGVISLPGAAALALVPLRFAVPLVLGTVILARSPKFRSSLVVFICNLSADITGGRAR